MEKHARLAMLPRVPIGREKTQDEFWLQQGNSGAINAFRQLTSTRHKAGRKKTSLPGGKLKPLFKNHAAAPRNVLGNAGARQVLPGITSPTLEPSTTSRYVMSGYLDNLPPEDPNTVRVYLTSNYEDMKAERAIIMKKAVPELQRFCATHGLHFQLVDFHWGVVGGAHNLDSSSDLRTKEIKACHKKSLGPAFVMLLGDKYGVPRLPTSIPVSVYEVLTAVASENQPVDADLLETFYPKDENAIPPCHILVVEDNSDDLSRLSDVLQSSADIARDSNRLTEEEHHQLTVSILEEEVEHGVFPLKDPRHHCLMYKREWQHVDASHSEASNMIDVVTNDNGITERDQHAQKRIKSLVERVTQHLGPTHCKSYYLVWSEDAGRTWAPTPEVQKHLEQLCSDFIEDCKHLVMQGLDRVGENKAVQLSVYSEVLFQSHLWASKSQYFQGQESLIFKIEHFLQDPRRNMKPFVIYGPPTSGKTATMAHLAERLRSSSTANCVVVLRFLGTSAESSNIYSVVVGLATQICLAYGLRVPKMDIHMNTLYRALQTFRETIEAVSQEQASARPLYILLDGIDQLHPMDESLRALWAICDLPHNVHLIISTVEQVGSVHLLQAFQNFVCGEGASEPIQPLSAVHAKDILCAALQSSQRKITSDQETKILAAYSANPNPLYLKALVRNAQRMTSFNSADLLITESLEDSFWQYIEGMKEKYGQEILTKIVSYISISGVGIHEKELLDLLLCDEDVMEEVSRIYIRHADGVAGFPQIIWAAIKDDLRDFIEDHNAYGVSVIGWNHAVCNVILSQKLGVIYPGIDESKITSEGTALTLALHEYITNMYVHENSEWHANVVSNWDLPDLSTCQSTAQTPQLTHIHNATLLSPQPTNVHNILKLQKLPLHLFVLVPIEGLGRLTEVMFGSLKWLKTKLKAVSMQSVLHDLAPVITLGKHFVQAGVIEEDALLNDLQVVLEFLQLAQDALIDDPERIVQEVLARLPDLSNRYPTVASLVDQAHAWLTQTKGPYLSPVYPCLPQPNNPLRHSLEGPTHVIGFLPNKISGVFFCQSSSVDVWKLDTGELLHRYAVNPEQALDSVITMSNQEYIIIAHYSHLKHIMELGVWGIETGIQVMTTTFEYRFEALALDPQDKQLMVSTVIENETSNDGGHRCLLGVDINTKDVLVNIIVEDIHREGISKIIFTNNVNEAVNGLLTIGSKLSKDLAFWDLSTEQLCFCLELDCYIDHVKVVESDSIAVCVSSDAGKVIVVDLEGGVIKYTTSNAEYEGLSSMCVSKSAEYVLLATKHHGIAVISLTSGTQTKTLGEQVKFNQRPSQGKLPATLPIPTQITVDPDEHFVFVGCLNGLIKIYSIATGDYIDTLNGHGKTMNSLVFDKFSRLYSASNDGIARIWQVAPILDQYRSKFSEDTLAQWDGIRQFDEAFDSRINPEDIVTVSHPTEREEVQSMTITSDGKHVITASATRPVKLWAVHNGNLVQTYKDGCSHGASQVYLAYKDQFIVAHCHHPDSTRTNILQVWRLQTGEVVRFGEKPVFVFTSCQTPDGKKLFTVSPSEKKPSGIVLGLYDLYDPRQLASLPCNIYGAMDRTNMHLLGCVVSTPGQIGMTPIPEVLSMTTTPQTPESITSSSNQEQSQGGEDEEEETVTYAVLDYFPEEDLSYFFTFVIGEEKISMERHVPLHLDTRSPSCSVLSAGRTGISGAVDGSLVAWDVRHHTVVANFTDPALATAARMGSLRYPSSSGQPGHDGAVTCVRLSSDGSHLVSGGVDMQVKVWHVAQRSLLKMLTGHTGTVLAVDISLDVRIVASGSADKTVAVWGINSGNKLASFCTHNNPQEVTMLTQKSRLFAVSCGNLISLQMDNV